MALDSAIEIAQGEPTYLFDITSKPLPEAMIDFSAVTGLEVLYTEPAPFGQTAPALQGTLTAKQALDRLMAGSGLSYRYTSANAVTLERNVAQEDDDGPIMLGPVTVEAKREFGPNELPPEYAGGQVASGSRMGVLGNRDWRDTPFTTFGLTEKTIADSQARSASEVLIRDPGVRPQSPRGGVTDNVSVRGFPVFSPSFTFDGVHGLANIRRSQLEGTERIEVLKGPTSFLYGIPPLGGVGGTINLVPKRADDEPLTRFTARYMSASVLGGHLDVARRFGPLGEFGVRANVSYEIGDGAIDDQEFERGNAYLGLDYRGERFRASLDAGNERLDQTGIMTNRLLLNGVPSAPDPELNPNGGGSEFFNDRLFGLLRAEFDITPDVTVFGAFGARSTNEYSTSASTLRIQNTAGDYVLPIFQYRCPSEARTGQLGVRASLETGPVSHELVLSANALRETQENVGASVGTCTGNIHAPTPCAVPALGFSRSDAFRVNEQEFDSVSIADTMSILDDRVQLTLGARAVELKQTNYSFSTPGEVTSVNKASAVTPAVALLVKPLPELSLFANYVEALRPGDVAPAGTVNAGESFPALRSEQFEIGAKYEFDERLGLSISLFRIEQPSGFTDTNNRFDVNGLQRNRGIELSAFGEPFDGFRFFGGLSFLDAKIIEGSDPATEGQRQGGVAPFTGSLSAEYDLPFAPGLSVNGTVVHSL